MAFIDYVPYGRGLFDASLEATQNATDSGLDNSSDGLRDAFKHLTASAAATRNGIPKWASMIAGDAKENIYDKYKRLQFFDRAPTIMDTNNNQASLALQQPGANAHSTNLAALAIMANSVDRNRVLWGGSNKVKETDPALLQRMRQIGDGAPLAGVTWNSQTTKKSPEQMKQNIYEAMRKLTMINNNQ